jgi:hypothetical protein
MWWIVIGDKNSNKLYAIKSINNLRKTQSVNIEIEPPEAGNI